MTLERIRAPFTRAQVEALNNWQRCGWAHPFTCVDRGDRAHRAYAPQAGRTEVGVLIATRIGWVCPVCGHRQDWAHEFMLRLPHPPPWFVHTLPKAHPAPRAKP
jgi:hypothetical protein